MFALEVVDLQKCFVSPDGERQAIVDVPRLTLAPGEQVALAGSSGSGKTTFLHLIAGILQADHGHVRIDGEDICAANESRRDRIRAGNIGYIFQTFNLLQGYTALENVELAMRFGGGLDHRFARELLERVGLAQRLHYRPRQLSVGQQQRVAVARALANHPRLVLADEPTGNLDPRHAADAINLIRTLCRENDAALLVVSHDPRVLEHFERVEPFAELNRALSPATTVSA